MNMSYIIVSVVMAVVVIFFVIGFILNPTVEASIEEQEAFIDAFTAGILRTENSEKSTMKCIGTEDVYPIEVIDNSFPPTFLYSNEEYGTFISGNPGPLTMYTYESTLGIILTEPETEVKDLDVMTIAYLDDRTFALGQRSDGKVSVIEFPYILEADMKFKLFTSKENKGIIHLTFWEWQINGCVEKNMEKKSTLLGLVEACPKEYFYASFVRLDKIVDNSAC